MPDDDLVATLPVLFSQLEIDLLTSQASHQRQSLAEFLRSKLDLPHNGRFKAEYNANSTEAGSRMPALRLHVSS